MVCVRCPLAQQRGALTPLLCAADPHLGVTGCLGKLLSAAPSTQGDAETTLCFLLPSGRGSQAERGSCAAGGGRSAP